MVMKGYLNLPHATGEAMTSDGFFKSGDVGRFDDDGYLYITGRTKEMISIAGEKVAPREIEEILMENPGVSEAAVTASRTPRAARRSWHTSCPRKGSRPARRNFARSAGRKASRNGKSRTTSESSQPSRARRAVKCSSASLPQRQRPALHPV